MSKNRTETGAKALAPESIESREPSDAELLVGLQSHYDRYPPDQMIKGANSESAHRASELVARERAAYLRRRRTELAQVKAEQARLAQLETQKNETIERARRLEARSALAVAVRSYQRWLDRRTQLADELAQCEKKLADLLAAQPAEGDLEILRAHSVAIGDSRLLVEALRAQISAWNEKRSEPLGALREALNAAQGELTVLHQSERERRIKAAQSELEALIDWNELYILRPYNAPALRDLAQAARVVVELDQAIGYSNGRYAWSYPVGDNELLPKADRLDAAYNALVP